MGDWRLEIGDTVLTKPQSTIINLIQHYLQAVIFFFLSNAMLEPDNHPQAKRNAAAAGGAKHKKSKQEWLAFRGIQHTRVGAEFQVAHLPSPTTTPVSPQRAQKQEQAGANDKEEEEEEEEEEPQEEGEGETKE